jgi:GT2 family glycosyltransferase
VREHEKVTVAYPRSKLVEGAFAEAMYRLFMWDLTHTQRFVHDCPLVAIRCTDIAQGRNKIVDQFLEHSKAEWLWFVDTDQTFDPLIVERLLQSADPDERPILSALVMANREPPHPPVSPACVIWHPDKPATVAPLTIPTERHWRVAAPGTGCLLIHRTVLEKVGAEWEADPWRWFKYDTIIDDQGNSSIMGEDYVFALRAQKLGFSCWVDTTIEAGHIKERELWSRDFWAQVPPSARPRKTWVVIPVKNRRKMTEALLRQLHESGGFDHLLVMDNGSDRTTKNWLETQDLADLVSADGLGIHEMWNLGIEAANQNSPAGFDIAFLNNDLTVGPGMIDGLKKALAEHAEIVAVSPNYDQRPGEGVEYTHNICGDRYDGTGGLAGFCFMVRGEWFQMGYRFPPELKWYFGDNDIVQTITANGAACAIALDVSCEHIGGGSQTGGKDYDNNEVYQADLKAFCERWNATVQPAEVA